MGGQKLKNDMELRGHKMVVKIVTLSVINGYINQTWARAGFSFGFIGCFLA